MEKHFKLFPCGRRKKKRMLNKMLGVICSCMMIVGYIVPLLPALEVNAQGNALLSNLIIDKVYSLEAVGGYGDYKPNDTGFAPEVTDYRGTAYYSVDEIKVYPFTESDSAEVTVNGEELNADGYVSMDVSTPGRHDIEIEVKDADASRQYNVSVEKVENDYRGRTPIINNEKIMKDISVDTPVGNEESLMEILKKDKLVVLPESSKSDGSYVETDESYWSAPGNIMPDASGTKEPTTLFTVDLGDTYSVSRIRAAFGPSNLNLSQNRVKISVSTDGQTWESPITKGNMNTGVQWHQNVTRYEFGVSYDARYIRFEVTNWQFPEKELRIYQFMIFYDAAGAPEKMDPPEGAGVPHTHEERHQYLASGQATAVERGLSMMGWTPSSGYGRGVPTADEADQFGYDGPLFYDPDFQNPDYMLYNPDALWGIAKAPFGGNNMSAAGEPRDFIPEEMEDYIGNAVSFCFGDEGGYSTQEAENFGKWFDWTREHYPGVILHSNQCMNQWGRDNMLEYMKIAEPDLLTWDDYYGDSSWANPSSINLSNENTQKDGARRLLNLSVWELYRELAYQGIDGTGSRPIMFGQYVDTFALSHSQSNKNLIVNTSILSGMKWLNFFRIEYQFDRSYLWDEDGTPTRGLLEWGQIIDRVHAVDDQLTRLNNDWIMFKVGEMGNADTAQTSAEGFRMGNFDSEESRAKNSEFGLSSISVESLSETHDGKTGDVVLGYYNTLPGLYESEIEEYFAGATAPKAFMVMNGLTAGQAEQYNKENIVNREAGSSENTKQEITVTVDPSFAENYTLYKVNKDVTDENGSGKIEEVALDNNSFTVTLGGGEAELYFWNTDTTAGASSQSEGHYASFAFDGHKDTYWQPGTESTEYVLENTFEARSFDRVTISEKGDAVQSFKTEYKDAETGEWKAFGEEGTIENGVGSTDCGTPVKASGIRIVFRAEGLPAIYEVETLSIQPDENAAHTVTVNDNTMGEGLFRFSYDDLWSYRETERNASTGAGTIYPLENDGHFSNFNGAEAKLTFYGEKVELLVRTDQAAKVKAGIADENGDVSEWKTGSGRSIIFEDLEPGVHTLKIQKTDAAQGGIDGAVVTYRGEIPETITEKYKDDPKSVQDYLNQRTTDPEAQDHFTYEPSVTSKNMESKDTAPEFAGPSEEEHEGWIEYVQDGVYHNLGFTRTDKEGASYTIQFYGTGVQLYSGAVPFNSAEPGYGNMTFELDGEKIDAVYATEERGTNGKISLRVAEVNVENAEKNELHTLKVTTDEGWNRIDYAVVNRFDESRESTGKYTVTVSAGENGGAELLTESSVMAGGNAVVQITPDEGYVVDTLIVNNKTQTAPADGRLIITNIREDISVEVTFKAAPAVDPDPDPVKYSINIAETEGGSISSSLTEAEAGDTVILMVKADEGYKLKAGSLKVTAGGNAVSFTYDEDKGSVQFTMPESNVDITAVFEKNESTDPTPDPNPAPDPDPNPAPDPAPGAGTGNDTDQPGGTGTDDPSVQKPSDGKNPAAVQTGDTTTVVPVAVTLIVSGIVLAAAVVSIKRRKRQA